jgi:hypothetical protein
MYDLSGEVTVILIADWWLQKSKRLVVSKQAAQKFDVDRFNLKKLSELEVRKQYQIEITNRFAALENLIYDKDINRAWESIN